MFESTIVLIDPFFSAIHSSKGSDIKDAVELFKSSVWQQGWGADQKVMRDYGDWSVYEKLSSTRLEYRGLMKDI